MSKDKDKIIIFVNYKLRTKISDKYELQEETAYFSRNTYYPWLILGMPRLGYNYSS